MASGSPSSDELSEGELPMDAPVQDEHGVVCLGGYPNVTDLG